MQYLIILGVLVVIALLLIVIIIVALMRGRQQRSEEEYAEDYEEEPDREELPRRRRRRQEPDPEDPEGAEESEQPEVEGRMSAGQDGEGAKVRSPKPKSKKKQWKVVLENEESWQKHSYVFYDNIGIGRSRSNSVFEKYLSVPDDPRVSKVHCAIIQNEGKLYLKDLGARNGTYLNGKRISQPVLIQRDDIIGLGETKIEVKSIMKEKQETEE